MSQTSRWGVVSSGGPTEFFRIRDLDFLPGDRLPVVNGGTEEIRFFTRAGAFLGSVGRKGNGPKEFNGLRWLAATGDSLLTYDSGNDRLSVRDRLGLYGRTFRLEWLSGILSPVEVLSDGSVLGLTARHIAELIARVATALRPVEQDDIAWFWGQELASDNETYVRSLQRVRDRIIFSETFVLTA